MKLNRPSQEGPYSSRIDAGALARMEEAEEVAVFCLVDPWRDRTDAASEERLLGDSERIACRLRQRSIPVDWDQRRAIVWVRTTDAEAASRALLGWSGQVQWVM